MKFAGADFCLGNFYDETTFVGCSFYRIKAHEMGWGSVIIDSERQRDILARHIIKGLMVPRRRKLT